MWCGWNLSSVFRFDLLLLRALRAALEHLYMADFLAGLLDSVRLVSSPGECHVSSHLLPGKLQVDEKSSLVQFLSFDL